MIWTLTFSRIWLAEKFSLIFPSDNHCILNRPCAVRCNIFTSCHFGRVLPQRACHTRFICDRGIDFDFVESVWPKSAEAKIDRKDWLISLRSESVDLKRRSAYSTNVRLNVPQIEPAVPQRYLQCLSRIIRFEQYDWSIQTSSNRRSKLTIDKMIATVLARGARARNLHNMQQKRAFIYWSIKTGKGNFYSFEKNLVLFARNCICLARHDVNVNTTTVLQDYLLHWHKFHPLLEMIEQKLQPQMQKNPVERIQWHHNFLWYFFSMVRCSQNALFDFRIWSDRLRFWISELCSGNGHVIFYTGRQSTRWTRGK